MEIGSLFSGLFLGEVSLVLLVILIFSIRHNLKQRSLLKRLHEKYSEAKAAHKLAATEKTSVHEGKKTAPQHMIEEYFEQSLADSLQRYEKIPAQSTLTLTRTIHLAAAPQPCGTFI
jgi:adenine-specific DNA methylase